MSFTAERFFTLFLIMIVFLFQVSTSQSAAVSHTSPAGTGSVFLSVLCVMKKALTTVGMEVTWKKISQQVVKVSQII